MKRALERNCVSPVCMSTICDAPGDYHFLYPHFDVLEEAMSLLLCLYTQLFAYQCCIEKGYTPGISLGIPEDRWVVS